MAFAATLRTRRQAAGLTVRQLAAEAGLHWRTVLKLERAERRPTLRTAVALAAALGCPLESLANGA